MITEVSDGNAETRIAAGVSYNIYVEQLYDDTIIDASGKQQVFTSSFRNDAPIKTVFEHVAFEKTDTADEGDNFGDRRAIIYARNACFELARQIGATHFIELDDDYTYFKFRFDDQLRWHGADVQDLDAVFDMLLDYFNSAPMLTLAIGQGGDYIGGEKATRFNDGIQPMRKAMNSFICSVDRPFQFVGRINEDVNTYVLLGSRGGGISVYPTNRPRPTRNAEQQRRHDRSLLGFRNVCKEFLHGHVLPVMRGCFGNGNRPSAAASSHQMAIRRAEDTARIG